MPRWQQRTQPTRTLESVINQFEANYRASVPDYDSAAFAREAVLKDCDEHGVTAAGEREQHVRGALQACVRAALQRGLNPAFLIHKFAEVARLQGAGDTHRLSDRFRTTLPLGGPAIRMPRRLPAA